MGWGDRLLQRGLAVHVQCGDQREESEAELFSCQIHNCGATDVRILFPPSPGGETAEPTGLVAAPAAASRLPRD